MSSQSRNKEVEKIIQCIIEHLSIGLVFLDFQGKILFMNQKARDLLPDLAQASIGASLKKVLPSLASKLFDCLQKEQASFLETSHEHFCALTIKVVPLVINKDKKYAMCIIQENRKLLKELDAIIDSSYDGLWICDKEGRVIRINRASEKINDIKAHEVIGKKMQELVSQGLIDRSVTLEVLKTRTSATMIQRLRNGKQILVTGTPIFDDRGEIKLVVVNERDITELNRLRAELEQSRALARTYRSEIRNLHLQEALLDEVVVRSESMQQVLSTAMKVARVDSVVLIQGESGVGKTFLAKLIHRASKRRNGPFIRVDCGAIPESLIESELFGYEDGAFTGARAKGKPGQFELAEGGTLFLDEVGDLPLKVQVKLLRFLEENELIRIGGTRTRKIDVRVIAATQRNLEEMVKKGLFRKDLFFRLSVVPIKIPPLRERRDDIPSLIHFFLKKFNQKYSANKVISSRAIDCLCSYPFPGNIRELSNLVEQLVVLAPGNPVDVEDLPIQVRKGTFEINIDMEENGWNLRKAVERLEKRMIIRALKTFRSQRKAASRLGVNQSTLCRKAKKYHITFDAITHHDD